MPLTPAERQARHRQRLKEKLAAAPTKWDPAPASLDGARGDLLARATQVLKDATEAELDRFRRTLATLEAMQRGRALARGGPGTEMTPADRDAALLEMLLGDRPRA